MNGFEKSLDAHLSMMQSLRSAELPLQTAAGWCLEALSSGGKLLICGNGGSAAQAQHFSAELMGRYKNDRSPLAAIALAADAAVMTCIGNDYHFENVFSRQVKGLGRSGDVLVVFTSSGQSPNILEALRTARELKLKSICFLGHGGGTALTLSDLALTMQQTDVARIQEAHQFLMHCLVDLLEFGLKNSGVTSSFSDINVR